MKDKGCPAKDCGGCKYSAVPYEEQLKTKQKNMEKLLGEFGEVLPIIGMENPYYYRNKVHHAFSAGRNGQILEGQYSESTHRIIQVEECLLEDKISQEIIREIKALMPKFKMQPYNEKTNRGFLRHVLVRRGFTSGEIMVVLVTADKVFPSKNNFVKALREICPDITTIVQNVNNKFTSMVLGKENIVLFGNGYIKDTLCGCEFRISPTSFYQVNPVQTKVLYETAISYANLEEGDKVIDAYCGVGTIGLSASKATNSNISLIGVELNSQAVKDARLNAKNNDIKNAEFHAGDAGEFMLKMAAKGEHADVVFMDPPRSGSTPEFINAVAKMGPERLVYISCNPETLARDLRLLKKKGFKIEKIQPVEMFALTDHCETVVSLRM